MSNQLENYVQRKIKKELELFDWRVEKFVTTKKGDPDLIVFKMLGKCFFIECKREKGGRLSIHQKERIKEWRERGYNVYTKPDYIDIKIFINCIIAKENKK